MTNIRNYLDKKTMDISRFSEQFREKMGEIQAYLEGDDVRELMAGIAVEHFRESFRKEGFTDDQLNPWQEVERRKPDSPWYGHSGQMRGFSQARTTAKILTGETGHLSNAFSYVRTKEGIIVRNTAPYARVHQFGLKAKVYGKKEFTMPKRPFMGPSKQMTAEIRQEIINDITKILK